MGARGSAQYREFIVCYDYGQGAAWAVVRAKNSEQIKAKFPAVEIRACWPPSIDEVTIAAIRRNETYDIDDCPDGWLASLAGDPPA